MRNGRDQASTQPLALVTLQQVDRIEFPLVDRVTVPLRPSDREPDNLAGRP